jgi:hypothetical protein
VYRPYRLLTPGTPAEQVNHEQDRGDEQQKMDQVADDIKDKAEQPYYDN